MCAEKASVAGHIVSVNKSSMLTLTMLQLLLTCS